MKTLVQGEIELKDAVIRKACRLDQIAVGKLAVDQRIIRAPEKISPRQPLLQSGFLGTSPEVGRCYAVVFDQQARSAASQQGQIVEKGIILGEINNHQIGAGEKIPHVARR